MKSYFTGGKNKYIYIYKRMMLKWIEIDGDGLKWIEIV